ncbi:MAG: response regulator transcription factor [Chloroflexi bacterium]|nr:response regulator transcription factor [Chloroflexota bacterium]
MINVFITDDHAIVRQGLKQILEDAHNIRLVGEAATGRDALRQAQTATWDVMMLDMSLPDMSGFDILIELKHLRPSLSVLMLSMYPEDQFGIRALRAGASGYITKDSDPEEMVKAIRRVATGHKYISPHMAEILASQFDSDTDQPPHKRLSNREFQVFRMIGTGKTPSAIAADLSLSVKTVSTYRTRILTKLNLKSSGEMIHYAIQHQLID